MTPDEKRSDLPRYERVSVRRPMAARGDTDRAAKDSELLASAVLEELQVINGFMEFDIPEAAIGTLASAVTSRVESAFEVRWSPSWVARGRPHTWKEFDKWHARCNDCLAEAPASSSEDDAVSWFDAHYSSVHSNPESHGA
ncbi:hypothetical protein N1027_06095 [Herbiconiux sp. CPCC 205763]|uniref:Uncharacterized protein n=1 Tax=Herbiconiux aconitum TaxID=2970913 RepID=A0ABT2GNA3_9MICO|nr:hypothetical protein [Herbiconiux aconitum]MCS5717704.1 hypothetical protein [Herbiconiux aconitum]